MMPVAVARYGEIGTKSGKVRSDLTSVLRQRIENALEYEGLDFNKVYIKEERVVAELENTDEGKDLIKLLPGVKSVSPAMKTSADLSKIKEATEKFEYGKTFGVDPNTGKTDVKSTRIAEEVGSHIEDKKGSTVDLDNPDTLLRVDMRSKEAYVYTSKEKGPGGFPAGTNGKYLSLISGGIDSPVAAYRMMTRGADIHPIYFYNRPIAAEDHMMRFEAALNPLKKFFPSKKWEATIIDMEDVNETLMKQGRGRMVMHRAVMFKVAKKVMRERGLDGVVTGESLGQKSSQTAENLRATSEATEAPVFRPLLSRNKNSISQEARRIGTFEEAKVNSACRSLSPSEPATKLKQEEIEEINRLIREKNLVEKAISSKKEIEI